MMNYPSIFSRIRRAISLFTLTTLSFYCFAQNPLPSEIQIEGFLNSKTLVVLDGGLFSAYNIEIKDVMEKYWDITTYDFIEQDEFEERMTDSSYSFLMPTYSRFERDKSGRRYTFLNLLLGSNVKSISELPEFGHVPLTYTDDEDEIYVYKLRYMVQFLQRRVKELKNEDKVNAMKYLTYYNKNANLIKNYTLYIAEHDLSSNIRSESVIKKEYPYEIKIMNHEELEDALATAEDLVLFTHKAGPESKNSEGWAFKLIFGTDGTLYYYNKHNIKPKKPNGFTSSDFKRIGRY